MSDDQTLSEIRAEDRVGDVISRLRHKLFSDFTPLRAEMKEARAGLREATEIADRASARARAALALKL